MSKQSTVQVILSPKTQQGLVQVLVLQMNGLTLQRKDALLFVLTGTTLTILQDKIYVLLVALEPTGSEITQLLVVSIFAQKATKPSETLLQISVCTHVPVDTSPKSIVIVDVYKPVRVELGAIKSQEYASPILSTNVPPKLGLMITLICARMFARQVKGIMGTI